MEEYSENAMKAESENEAPLEEDSEFCSGEALSNRMTQITHHILANQTNHLMEKVVEPANLGRWVRYVRKTR